MTDSAAQTVFRGFLSSHMITVQLPHTSGMTEGSTKRTSFISTPGTCAKGTMSIFCYTVKGLSKVRPEVN